ncbi:hypothetical protein O181_073659 [Austropuccinia psidii MF-1]|uniref:Uncharacterized protein n=1 Tax=Austropuccinia psidii MF-1 TaxID=1389203 RepID=A0A9Q3F7K0_9BASI|nr:hypothetical protein [Austropuccinia psidii MF-1]
MSEGARARLGEVEDEEGEESVEEEYSGETEVPDALANSEEVPQGSNLAPTNQPLVSQYYPSLLKIMERAEQDLDNLRMKESGHLSLYIADFRSLMSIIGDWGERAYIHVYRRGLASRLLDQLASYPGNFDTFQDLMDITLELDTRYHEKQKEKGNNQENKPSVTGSNSSRLIFKKASPQEEQEGKAISSFKGQAPFCSA